MTKSRQKIHIVPNNGNWSVKKGGKVISNHRIKGNAVKGGVNIAKKQKPSQVVIHKKNGQIQTEHTYGKDPYPPDG